MNAEFAPPAPDLQEKLNEKRKFQEARVISEAYRRRDQMRRITAYICIAALLLALAVQASPLEQATERAAPKVLRLGFEKAKPLNNLDMLGSKFAGSVGTSAAQKPVESSGMLSRMMPKAAFNISQRTGAVAKFSYDTGIFRPIFNVSAYSSARPFYDVPGSVHKKPVYDIENYPRIKAVNSIP